MSNEQPNTANQPSAGPPPPNFIAVLKQMLGTSNKVSDLIFSPGRPPQIELTGKLQPVRIGGLEMLTPAHTAGIAKLIIGNQHMATESLEKTGSADLSFSAPGEARFRVNIFKQRGTHAIIMRVIPMNPPRFEDFNLPDQLKEIIDIKNGCGPGNGPTGSGKSSTLAAIIDLINETHYYHIVTIEDPIEFLHKHKNSTIHQRELHSDTPSLLLPCGQPCGRRPKLFWLAKCAIERPSKWRWKLLKPVTLYYQHCTPSTRRKPWIASLAFSRKTKKAPFVLALHSRFATLFRND